MQQNPRCGEIETCDRLVTKGEFKIYCLNRKEKCFLGYKNIKQPKEWDISEEAVPPLEEGYWREKS